MRSMVADSTTLPFRIDHLPPYILGDVGESVRRARREGRDIIDLSQASPDPSPSPAAVDRLVQSVLRPHNHRYSASRGITALRQAFAEWYLKNFAVKLDPDSEVIVTMGTKEGLTHLLLAMLNPGESVLIPTPSYPIHNSATFIAGGSSIGVELYTSPEEFFSLGGVLSENSTDFFHRLEVAYSQTWPRPRAMILSFPHNPTCLTVTSGFFERLVKFATGNGLALVHDFAYGTVTFDDYQAPSILQTPGAKSVAVELFSLSKSFGVPGWRMSFCVGNSRLIEALGRIKSYIDSGGFQPLQIASIKSLERFSKEKNSVAALYQARRDLVYKALQQQGWELLKPRGTVFLWGRPPEPIAAGGSVSAARQLLEEADVAVCPGRAFGVEGESFLRFALMESEQRLALAVERLGRLVNPVIVRSAVLLLVICCALRCATAEDCVGATKLSKQGAAVSSGSADQERYFRKAIELCPSLADAHFNLGSNLLAQKKIEQGIASLKRAVGLEPEVAFLVGLGNGYLLKGDYGAAETEFKRAAGLAPDNAAVLHGLALVADKNGRLEEAESKLRQAIQIDSKDGHLFYNLGVVLEREGRLEEALVSYGTAIDKSEATNGWYATAVLAKGRVASSLGRYAEAEQVLELAVALASLAAERVEILLLLSTTMERRGSFKQALVALDRALQIDKEHPTVRLNRGILLYKVGEREEGLALLKSLRESRPADAAVRGALGWGLLQEKQYDAAEVELREALRLDENSAFAHNNLGILLELKGDPAGARESLARAGQLEARKPTP